MCMRQFVTEHMRDRYIYIYSIVNMRNALILLCRSYTNDHHLCGVMSKALSGVYVYMYCIGMQSKQCPVKSWKIITDRQAKAKRLAQTAQRKWKCIGCVIFFSRCVWENEMKQESKKLPARYSFVMNIYEYITYIYPSVWLWFLTWKITGLHVYLGINTVRLVNIHRILFT